MLTLSSSQESGKRLRAERERLGLSLRDVERLSDGFAQQRKTQDYYISHAWLADIENGKHKPTFFKLYSLCVIYGCSYDKIAAFFGVPLGEIEKQHSALALPRTYLIGKEPEGEGRILLASLELQKKVQLEKTNLVTEMFKGRADIPIDLLQQMDWRNSVYGYIGIEDYTLHPLVRPGSFVKIDSRQRKVIGNWQNDFDRPIYFVELRGSYVCSWCELHGDQLILIPTPHTRARARHVRYPTDADIVGRVTAVTMTIAEVRENLAEGPSPA
jgi:transcriptional regulator with XRE-family HTH domain